MRPRLPGCISALQETLREILGAGLEICLLLRVLFLLRIRRASGASGNHGGKLRLRRRTRKGRLLPGLEPFCLEIRLAGFLFIHSVETC